MLHCIGLQVITARVVTLCIARRLLAIASEDVGNADPRAMQVAISAGLLHAR